MIFVPKYVRKKNGSQCEWFKTFIRKNKLPEYFSFMTLTHTHLNEHNFIRLCHVECITVSKRSLWNFSKSRHLRLLQINTDATPPGSWNKIKQLLLVTPVGWHWRIHSSVQWLLQLKLNSKVIRLKKERSRQKPTKQNVSKNKIPNLCYVHKCINWMCRCLHDKEG